MQSHRYNIYTFVHKGLRAALCQTLVNLGRADSQDPRSLHQILQQATELLHFCQSHLEHENSFIHQAIQQQDQRVHLTTIRDHHEHESHIKSLLEAIASLDQAAALHKTALLLNLYREFALFVAENFTHMHIEETINAQILWETFSDEQIARIEQSIVEAHSPLEQHHITLLILTNLNATERMQMLEEIQQHMPDDGFKGLMASLKSQLHLTQWELVANQFGLAA